MQQLKNLNKLTTFRYKGFYDGCDRYIIRHPCGSYGVFVEPMEGFSRAWLAEQKKWMAKSGNKLLNDTRLINLIYPKGGRIYLV